MERADLVHMLSLPFEVSAERIGAGFTDELKQSILELRQSESKKLAEWTTTYFAPFDEANFVPGMTVLENAIFGKLSASSGQRAEQVRDIVATTLLDAGMKQEVAELLFAVPTGIGGRGSAGGFCRTSCHQSRRNQKARCADFEPLSGQL